MIKNLAWNTFKNTGDINTFMEMIEIQNVEKEIVRVENYGDNKEQRDCNC